MTAGPPDPSDPRSWSAELPSTPPASAPGADGHGDDAVGTRTPDADIAQGEPEPPTRSALVAAIVIVLALAAAGGVAAVVVGQLADRLGSNESAQDQEAPALLEPVPPSEWNAMLLACDQLADRTVAVEGRVRNSSSEARTLFVVVLMTDTAGETVIDLTVAAGTVAPGAVGEFSEIVDLDQSGIRPRCSITSVLAGS